VSLDGRGANHHQSKKNQNPNANDNAANDVDKFNHSTIVHYQPTFNGRSAIDTIWKAMETHTHRNFEAKNLELIIDILFCENPKQPGRGKMRVWYQQADVVHMAWSNNADAAVASDLKELMEKDLLKRIAMSDKFKSELLKSLYDSGNRISKVSNHPNAIMETA
jgi:hypothetical protein